VNETAPVPIHFATVGRVEEAAYALWRQDAAKSPATLNAERHWPRVRRYYLKRAQVALLAAEQAEPELTLEQRQRAGLPDPPPTPEPSELPLDPELLA
jgi:hypothetical protein